MYPLKDVLDAVEHEDVKRHADNLKDSLSQVSLGDVASLAYKAPSMFGSWRDNFNAAVEKAKREAEAKGIDVEAEMAKLHAEDL
mgnify:CR=1 FL=1